MDHDNSNGAIDAIDGDMKLAIQRLTRHFENKHGSIVEKVLLYCSHFQKYKEYFLFCILLNILFYF